MNKELEVLRIIENFNINYEATVKYDEGPGKTYKYKTIKDMFSDEFALIEAAIKENFKMKLVIIAQEKETKALEIIKKKKVNVRFLISCKTLKEYNDVISDHLTQEEYDIVKEILK